MILQEFYFREALKEAGMRSNNSIKIDHYIGKCYYENNEFNLIFPLYMCKIIKNMSKTKTLDCVFEGVITEKRSWISKFAGLNSVIVQSTYGRNKETKH
jgi:hypothetical protein